MTLSAIRAAIVATLIAIPNIGRVHDFERYARQEGDFRDLYLYDLGAGVKQIRGWHVRRVAAAKTYGQDDVTDNVTWRIRGYMAISDADASEKTFDGLIEAIRDAFEADITLGGTVLATISENGEAITLEEAEPVLLAGVLCHSARLRLVTRSTHF